MAVRQGHVDIVSDEHQVAGGDSEGGGRPRDPAVFHQLEARVEAHVFIAFLAYCLHVTLARRLHALAPGLTPRSVLGEVCRHADDRRAPADHRRSRAAAHPLDRQPEPDLSLLLTKLNGICPPNRPPRSPPGPCRRSRCSAELLGVGLSNLNHEPKCSNSAKLGKAAGCNAGRTRRVRRAENSILRRNAGNRSVEYSLGSVLRAGSGMDRSILRVRCRRLSKYGSGVLSPKDVELLSIAFDASITHMYAPGTHRHIRAALKLGATIDEIMEVLKLCVVQGVCRSWPKNSSPVRARTPLRKPTCP